MLKKGIFGGTFDPIHNGHLNIAYEALYALNLDKIYFMPTGNPPHKNVQGVTSPSLRYEMVKTAIRDEKYFDVCDYEINKENKSYTYETVAYFKKKETETLWYFITGADCLFNLEKWKNIREIFRNCKLVVFERKGYNKKEMLEQKKYIESRYNTDIILIKAPILEISSTDIRKSIKLGKNINFLIPQGVYNTILNLKLYK